MSNLWFTSDTHFDHKNILKFARGTRTGNDILEMNELLIQAWNGVVRPGDEVWHLGDLSFGDVPKISRIVTRLNGRINLVTGNHDKKIKWNKDIQRLFESVQSYKTMVVGSAQLVLFHFPIYEWEDCHKGSIHFHGHTHGSVQFPDQRVFDVGVDNRPDATMRPWNLDELLPAMLAREPRRHKNKDSDGKAA